MFYELDCGVYDNLFSDFAARFDSFDSLCYGFDDDDEACKVLDEIVNVVDIDDKVCVGN